MRRFTQEARTGKTKVWEITCVRNGVQVMWGLLGGAMQETTQTFEAVNVGKANEKSPETVAQEWMDRQILGRNRKGYVEVDLKTNKPLLDVEAPSEIDFTMLPLSLRFFKPQNSMNKAAEKLVAAGDAFMPRKRNGMMHVITIGEDGEPRMYGSTMLICHKDEDGLPWMDRYPHIYEELVAMNLPPRTILLGEVVTTAWTGKYRDTAGFAKDSLEYVGSIIKALTPLALERQKVEPLGFCIWDVSFWEGECLLNSEVAPARYRRISTLLELIPNRKHVSMPELITVLPDKTGFRVESWEGGEYRDLEFEFDDPENIQADLLEWAKNLGWEGYVVIDPYAVYDNRAFNFRGKAERPKTVCKLKPMLEADFIVRWDPDNGIGRRGKGKKSAGVGSVQAYLWDPDVEEEVPISLVGGGLGDDDVKRLADPSLYPMVWQIEFSAWTAKGSLQFPEFVRERDDKTPEECLIYQRPMVED